MLPTGAEIADDAAGPEIPSCRAPQMLLQNAASAAWRTFSTYLS